MKQGLEMSDMIDHVARAIRHDWIRDKGDEASLAIKKFAMSLGRSPREFDDLPDRLREAYRSMAKAAIDAMGLPEEQRAT